MPPSVSVVVDETGETVGHIAVGPADLALVDRLARLVLAARRGGRSVHVHGAPEELRALVTLLGLAGALRLEPGREAEVLEQLGEDEVVQPVDPPA